jgi:hypothetical protein
MQKVHMGINGFSPGFNSHRDLTKYGIQGFKQLGHFGIASK